MNGALLAGMAVLALTGCVGRSGPEADTARVTVHGERVTVDLDGCGRDERTVDGG